MNKYLIHLESDNAFHRSRNTNSQYYQTVFLIVFLLSLLSLNIYVLQQKVLLLYNGKAK